MRGWDSRTAVLWWINILLVMLISSCHDDCETGTTRCNGERVEVCNTNTDWEVEVDCSEIEDFGLDIEWACCVDPEDGLHSCLPLEGCSDSDGGS